MGDPIEPSVAAFVPQIRACEYAKFANSEDYIERVLGYKIVRKQVAAGRHSLIFKCDKVGFPDLHCIVKPYRGGKDNVKRSLKEETCQIMRFCDSKCASIINFIDICYTSERIYVMVDWSSKGDLVHHLKPSGAGGILLDEAQVRTWALDIMNGLDWLHAHAICHHNVAPSVLLLTNDLHVKLSALSDAAIYSSPDGKLIKQKWLKFDRVNHWNQPPEVAKRQDYDPRRADVWSLGATLFWMMTRSHPMNYKNLTGKLTQQLEYSFHQLNRLSQPCQDYMKGLLNYQPSQRLTLKAALAHTWVSPDAPAPPAGEIVIPMDAPQVPGTALGPNEVDGGSPEPSASNRSRSKNKGKGNEEEEQ